MNVRNLIRTPATSGEIYLIYPGNPWADPGIGQPVDGPRKKWKADLLAVETILHFLCKTGKFTTQVRTDEKSEAKLEQGQRGS
jgi:hypothetical protein